MVIFNVFSNNTFYALLSDCVLSFRLLFSHLKSLLSTWQRLHIFLGLGLMVAGSHVTLASSIPNIDINDSKWSKYDHHFKTYTKKFFGNQIDWRVFKAQAIIESRLQIKAKSEVGARGLMQIMPRTYKEIQKKNSFFRGKSLKNPEWNIAAGIYYNSYLFKRWDQELTAEKRIQLMLASYNAGFSRTVKAFNRAGKPANHWLAVKPLLPKQTSDYVHRIDGLLDKALNKSPKKKAPKTLLAQVTE